MMRGCETLMEREGAEKHSGFPFASAKTPEDKINANRQNTY